MPYLEPIPFEKFSSMNVLWPMHLQEHGEAAYSAGSSDLGLAQPLAEPDEALDFLAGFMLKTVENDGKVLKRDF